ncbi:MAG: hypothetical protein ABEJ83_05655 [Candidatus Nanohaloarchaea archaeon]
MKGQTQAVTAIMITTVIVGSIATAYLWGIPILEKRKAELKVQNTQQQVLSLHQQITEVANAGKGTTRQIQIGREGQDDLEIKINNTADYIQVSTISQTAPYAMDRWTIIDGKTAKGLSFSPGNKKYAEKKSYQPGVVAVRPIGSPGTVNLNYRTEFRNMYLKTPTGAKLEKIDLTAPGRKESTGQTTIIISNEGVEQDTGSERIQIDTGEKLRRERTQISIKLR